MITSHKLHAKFRLLEKRGLLLWKCSETYRTLLEKARKERKKKVGESVEKFKTLFPYRASTITKYICILLQNESILALSRKFEQVQTFFLKGYKRTQNKQARIQKHLHFDSLTNSHIRFDRRLNHQRTKHALTRTLTQVYTHRDAFDHQV